MTSVDEFAELVYCDTLAEWRDKVFALASAMGYEQMALALFPDRDTPVAAENAFLLHSISPEWVNKYNAEEMYLIDPVVAHCTVRSTPLVWSPASFSGRSQRAMYEEASGYGLQSGAALPIHGASGEFGILCVASDRVPGKDFDEHAERTLPLLSCFRDFVVESAGRFAKTSAQYTAIRLSNRELECLKWSAAGKSSWEISRIVNCSEATVNFHFGNIRRKLNAKSRQQAVVKAIRMGLIYPA